MVIRRSLFAPVVVVSVLAAGTAFGHGGGHNGGSHADTSRADVSDRHLVDHTLKGGAKTRTTKRKALTRVEVDVPDDGIAGRDRVLSGNGHGLLRCARLSPERGFHGWDQSYGGNGFWGCEGEAWVWVQAAWWVSPQYPGWIWVAQQTTFDEVAQADVTEEGYWTPAV